MRTEGRGTTADVACQKFVPSTSSRRHAGDDQAKSAWVPVVSVLAFQLTTAFSSLANAADPGEKSQAESAGIERLIRETSAYVLQVPDAERYRLRASSDWTLKWQASATADPAAAGASAPKPIALAPSLVRKRFHAEIATAAQNAGVDPALVHAVIGVESAYREQAVSPKGAVGLMQVMPDTGRRYGVENLTMPSQNIRAGTRYLSDLMRMFNGDLNLVLAAYNAGENAVMRHGRRVPPYPETLRYVPRVLQQYNALRETTSAPAR